MRGVSAYTSQQRRGSIVVSIVVAAFGHGNCIERRDFHVLRRDVERSCNGQVLNISGVGRYGTTANEKIVKLIRMAKSVC